MTTFDYQKIIDQLVDASPKFPEHREAIGYFIYALENNHRMHWIDDVLSEDYDETTESLAQKLNITLS